VQMALYESPMGWSSSHEKWSGWDNMMASYQSLLDNTAAPKFVMLDSACTTDGRAYVSSDPAVADPIRLWYGGGAPYAFARYAIASVLMRDGYAALHAINYSQQSPMWIDEYDLAGTAGTGWLGAPLDPTQTAPYQSGVYFRRFQNGAALVNPRSNPGTHDNNRTAVNVTIPTSLGLFKHFQGTQDATTNNGQNLPLNGSGVPNLTIQPGDGIVLLRQ